MEWLASLGIAYGGTYVIAFPLRTVEYRGLFWSSFIMIYIVSVVSLIAMPIPALLQIGFGFSMLTLGLVLAWVYRKVAFIEERYSTTQNLPAVIIRLPKDIERLRRSA